MGIEMSVDMDIEIKNFVDSEDFIELVSKSSKDENDTLFIEFSTSGVYRVIWGSDLDDNYSSEGLLGAVPWLTRRQMREVESGVFSSLREAILFYKEDLVQDFMQYLN